MIIDSGRQIDGVLEMIKTLMRGDDIPEEEKFYHTK